MLFVLSKKIYDTSSQSFSFVYMFWIFPTHHLLRWFTVITWGVDELARLVRSSPYTFVVWWLSHWSLRCVCVCVSAPTYAGVITISPLSYSYPCRDTSLKVRGSFTILFKSRVVHLHIHTRSCSCMRHSHTHKQTPLHKYVSSLSWPHFEGFISF